MDKQDEQTATGTEQLQTLMQGGGAITRDNEIEIKGECYDQRKDAKTKQTQQLLMADEQDPARPEARLHNNLSHVQNLNMQTYSISQQWGLNLRCFV